MLERTQSDPLGMEPERVYSIVETHIKPTLNGKFKLLKIHNQLQSTPIKSNLWISRQEKLIYFTLRFTLPKTRIDDRDSTRYYSNSERYLAKIWFENFKSTFNLLSFMGKVFQIILVLLNSKIYCREMCVVVLIVSKVRYFISYMWFECECFIKKIYNLK